MHAEQVKRLKKDWAAKGGPPCEHPLIEKVRQEGAETGHKACVICGAFALDAKPKTFDWWPGVSASD